MKRGKETRSWRMEKGGDEVKRRMVASNARDWFISSINY